jgi:5-methylthioadenosine/S-adenosylhomocysteine deaminase
MFRGAFLERADVLIRGCVVLPMKGQGLISDGAIAIKDGKITYVGKRSSVANLQADLELGARGKVALPGLVNCHTHVPMTLFRGLAEDQPLNAWLKDTIWPLEDKLSKDDVYAGAALGCLEMIKGGTTCFADMYFHEDMVAEAVEQSGLRAALAEGIIEAGNKSLGEQMFKASVDFAGRFSGQDNGRVTAMLGPHASYSCSPELLTRIREKSSELNVRVHMHLAESKAMFKDFEKKHGSSEVEFLDGLGFLKSDVVAAHCLSLSSRDRQILSKRGVNVVHVPVANMKLGLGAAKVKDLLQVGLNVSLGTDGPASNNTLDMFETMKFAALLQKLAYHDPRVLSAYEALKMATIDGARALGLESDIGSLEVGKKADIILVDLSKPHLKPLHDIYASLVYSARASDVDTVIVDGKVLMENRQVETLNEQAVLEKAEKVAYDLVSR